MLKKQVYRMQQSPSWQCLRPDATDRPALLIFFASLACVCAALFGEQIPAIMLGIPAGCSLVLYACLRLQHTYSACSGFTLDDSARALHPHGRRPIPFSAIRSVRLILYRDRACLHVVSGALRRRRPLACVSRPGPVQDILQELTERCLPVRISKNPFTKKTADILPLMIMPLLAAVLLYVNIDMVRRFPALALPPRHISVEPLLETLGEQHYRLAPFSYIMPRHCHILERQPHALICNDRLNNTRIAITVSAARPTIPHSHALQAVAGMLGFGTVHEAAQLAVRSRFGLLPILIKSALLKHYDPDTMYIACIRVGDLSGIMLRGEYRSAGEENPEQLPDQITEIMLARAATNTTMHMLVTSPTPLDMEYTQRLIAGIK